MNICKYLNNFLSLDMLFKQVKIGEITEIKFDKEDIFSHYSYQSPYILFKPNFLDCSIKLRVEKEAHMPLYKIYGKHIETEELINEYIMKYGLIPLELHIRSSFSTYIKLEEEFIVSPPKVVILRFGDDVK